MTLVTVPWWLGFLLVGGLATWRLTRLLVKEAGPFDLFSRLRLWTGIYDEIGDDGQVYQVHPSWNPLYCMYCTSMWLAPIVGLLWYFGGDWGQLAVGIIALSGVTCVINIWEEGREER